MASYSGVIKARIVEVKFALAGKVSSVNKSNGDRVGKWDLLASLDRKMLQTELDRQLADYEKVRADFEIFNQKNPNPEELIDRYLKTEKQASLNASVKDVEISKSKLEMVDLLSPVNGTVIDDGGIVPGLNITPAGNPIKILDSDSYYFEFEIDQVDVKDFQSSKEGVIEIEGLGRTINETTKNILADGKRFLVNISISDTTGILIGLNGKANFQ